MVRYAPKYRLAFSLLNEDASAGGAVHSWDVEAGIDRESLVCHYINSCGFAPSLHSYTDKQPL